MKCKIDINKKIWKNFESLMNRCEFKEAYEFSSRVDTDSSKEYILFSIWSDLMNVILNGEDKSPLDMVVAKASAAAFFESNDEFISGLSRWCVLTIDSFKTRDTYSNEEEKDFVRKMNFRLTELADTETMFVAKFSNRLNKMMLLLSKRPEAWKLETA